MVKIKKIDLDKFKHKLEGLAVIYEERDIDTIIEDFKEQYDLVSSQSDAEGRSIDVLMKKAYNMLVATYALGDNREKFEAVVFGFRTSENRNANEIEKIKRAWAKGPQQRRKLIKEGKIITTKIDGEDTPLSVIERWEFTDDNEMIFFGKEWEEGEEIIPREYVKMLGDNKTTNFRYSRPMKDNWKLTFYGSAESLSDGITRTFIYDVYGEPANPMSIEFIPDNVEAYKLYNLYTDVDENKTTVDDWALKSKPEFIPIGGSIHIDDILYDLDEKEIISLVPVGFLREYHDEKIAIKDKNGNIVKTKSGYDKTKWNGYGQGIYQVLSASETKRGNYRLEIMDSSAPKVKISAFTEPHINIDFTPPAECIICWRSSKRPDRYDREQKQRIPDLKNGDINLNIMGIKCLFAYGGSEKKENVVVEKVD